MKKSSAIEAVSRAGWLRGVPPGFRDMLLRHCVLAEVPGGTLLYDHGSAERSLFGVAAGRLGVTLPVDAEGSCLIHVGGPGFWTGNVAAFTDLPRQVGIVTMGDCWLFQLPGAALNQIVAMDPGAWRWLANLASVNLATALEVIESLATSDPTQRVAKVILRLWQHQAGVGTRIPVTQDEIGMLARLSRSAVNAALARLVHAGAVTLSYRTVEIAGPERLAALAQGLEPEAAPERINP